MKIFGGHARKRFWVGLCLLLATGMGHAANTVTYVYTDPQGTPLAEADVNGNITATYNYTPYGSMAPNMSAPPNGPGYTGHVNDPDTGFVYMQARYYDPSMGRFLSTDPVDPAAGNVYNFNRYAYADNNPIKNTDPDGRCPSISDVCDAAKNLVRSVQNAAGKISGNAQSSSNTPTHASTSQRLAGESAADPKSDSVHMNQSLRTVTGDKSAPNIRPDVTTVNKDGSIDMVEVVSKGQTRDQMEDKLTAARQELGVPGNNTVVDPDPLPGMMVAPEPMSVPQPTVKPEGLPEMMTRPQVIEPEIFELP